MSRIRIRCRPPLDESVRLSNGAQIRINRIADLADCEIVAVADDGTETPLANVESLRFDVGGNEPARAVVTFVQPGLDVEAIDEVDELRAQVEVMQRWIDRLSAERAEMVGGHCPGCEPPGCVGMPAPEMS